MSSGAIATATLSKKAYWDKALKLKPNMKNPGTTKLAAMLGIATLLATLGFATSHQERIPTNTER
jgi:hypothetical protein